MNADAVGAGVPMQMGSEVFSWTSDAEVNQEQLGSQTIEGVVAEGTRVTFTIPAGKIGNERPIVTVNERWYSPELQTIVLSKNSDPRMGETTYRLTNIDRSEPDPSLFQVPADYKVEEGGFGRNFLLPEPPKVESRAETADADQPATEPLSEAALEAQPAAEVPPQPPAPEENPE